MGLALDGTANNNGSIIDGTSQTNVLTTANANDIICVITSGGFQTTSVTAAGLTFSQVAQLEAFGTYLGLFTAQSPLALSALTITSNQAGTVDTNMYSFGISGAPLTDYFDPNGALPTTVDTEGANLSFTTTNPLNFLLAIYHMGSTQNPTAGSGWIEMFSSGLEHNVLIEYQIVTTPQSGLVATIGGGATDNLSGIAAGIVGLPQLTFASQTLNLPITGSVVVT